MQAVTVYMHREVYTVNLITFERNLNNIDVVHRYCIYKYIRG